MNLNIKCFKCDNEVNSDDEIIILSLGSVVHKTCKENYCIKCETVREEKDFIGDSGESTLWCLICRNKYKVYVSKHRTKLSIANKCTIGGCGVNYDYAFDFHPNGNRFKVCRLCLLRKKTKKWRKITHFYQHQNLYLNQQPCFGCATIKSIHKFTRFWSENNKKRLCDKCLNKKRRHHAENSTNQQIIHDTIFDMNNQLPVIRTGIKIKCQGNCGEERDEIYFSKWKDLVNNIETFKLTCIICLEELREKAKLKKPTKSTQPIY